MDRQGTYPGYGAPPPPAAAASASAAAPVPTMATALSTPTGMMLQNQFSSPEHEEALTAAIFAPSVNVIVSMAVELRDKCPGEFKRLLKALNLLAGSDDEKMRAAHRKAKRSPFFISTTHPFPDNDSDQHCVKDSSDDTQQSPSFSFSSSSSSSSPPHHQQKQGGPPPRKRSRGNAGENCGIKGKKSSSAKKFNLPKLFSESEYYKCSFCNEKKTENSFRNHVHNNEKFRINWYCPICEKEYAVTYRGAHLKEKHGVSKDPKMSDTTHRQQKQQQQQQQQKQQQQKSSSSSSSSSSTSPSIPPGLLGLGMGIIVPAINAVGAMAVADAVVSGATPMIPVVVPDIPPLPETAATTTVAEAAKQNNRKNARLLGDKN